MSTSMMDIMNDLQLEDVEDYSAEYPTNEEDIRSTAEYDVQKTRHGVVSAFIMDNKKFVRAFILENKKVIVAASVAFLVVFGIALISTSSSSVHEIPASDDGYAPLILVDPSTVDPTISIPLLKQLEDLYGRHDLDKSLLDESAGDETPQRRAFFWLANEFNDHDSLDHSTRMTRYALAVLYYSTNAIAHEYEENPKTWLNANLWLSNSHACEWQGVVCNERLHVTAVKLERNSLSGSLPKELVILAEKLESLDLTSNSIFMEKGAFDAFSSLKNLKTLLMDDNYLKHKDGLPSQMSAMSNLEKLRLSYNMLEGPLAGESKVWENMSKLTHLEIESNFLTGSIPNQIGSMSNLRFLYLRRNSMQTNLDFLKDGDFTKLFALWLDTNNITGTIPSEVGTMASLASFSVTNSTLTGTIPTEIGNLSSLKRLWLYGNELTGDIPTQLMQLSELEVLEIHGNQLQGSMPDGVCKIIESADYAHKALTSDCDLLVACSRSCCTECF